MSTFWEIVFCVALLFRRHVCLSNLKQALSRKLPLTARKTVFSHLKVLFFLTHLRSWYPFLAIYKWFWGGLRFLLTHKNASETVPRIRKMACISNYSTEKTKRLFYPADLVTRTESGGSALYPGDSWIIRKNWHVCLKCRTWTSFSHSITTFISLCTAADSRIEQNR